MPYQRSAFRWLTGSAACTISVNLTLTFVSRAWTVSPLDFAVDQDDEGNCAGALFEMSFSASGPAWILGDTFLKNVYSVFRFDPPSIGFAELSTLAQSLPSDSDVSPAAERRSTDENETAENEPVAAASSSCRSTSDAALWVVVISVFVACIEY